MRSARHRCSILHSGWMFPPQVSTMKAHRAFTNGWVLEQLHFIGPLFILTKKTNGSKTGSQLN
jgi:hypothetical protein